MKLKWPNFLTRDNPQVKSKAVGLAADDWFSGSIGSLASSAGVRVGNESALTEPTLLAAFRNFSEDVAKIDLYIYERLPNGRSRIAQNHPLHKVFTVAPNAYQSPFEYVEYTEFRRNQYGNAYSLINRDNAGAIVSLEPINPVRVQIVYSPTGERFYQISGGDQFETAQIAPFLAQGFLTIPSEFIWHLKALPSRSGIQGTSVINPGAELIGSALAQQIQTGALTRNQSRPAGVLKHPGRISEEVAIRLKNAWNESYQGSNQVAKTALLEEGMEFETIAVTAQDNQWIQQRKFTVEQLARLCRMPLTKLQNLDKATYSNAEQENLAYLSDSLMPIFERWESSINRWLLSASEQQTYYAEFQTKQLLRGDIKARFDSYAVGRNWGIFSANELRVAEGLNPVDNGDDLLQPLNMTPIGEPAEGEPEPTPQELSIENVEQIIKDVTNTPETTNGETSYD